MILRRWDPGIGKDECDGGDKAYYDNHGERHRRLSPDHGERHRRLDLDIVGTGEGILGNLRKLRIMDDWGLISIIITKSQISEESGFVVVLLWFLTWELMTAPGVGPRHIMVSIWLLLVVLDHGYRWRRSALHQKEQTGCGLALSSIYIRRRTWFSLVLWLQWLLLVFIWWKAGKIRSYFGVVIIDFVVRSYTQMWYVYMLALSVLLGNWRQLNDFLVGNNLESGMWYWLIEMKLEVYT
ncbi:PREDICTED: uncharacterized protein LOC106314547 [Brassica oleracea var. oleracea]|uniref:uncharacterized protein LOC106314547 n=1 Tax=Brassica oleracea var. oleracea TaxID=109376 RepID=UPI0006A754F5|nr:PREDICTED: uncharacterized protein LOC106314547 [Brassica oleracea var. oleracea]